ncbi:TetR/AcrR family transcriptional regulator [Nocardia wallacei]|uniref:Transcriptional regulator n=1 Tax=Nocardia wallacei TaxID=480035 RepID=A0A7G1L194_9NOCA|nr:TetR/AcrR family transcriptional regulator [Nocardia wallacei]BCK59134.1 transcriptional regulator [Nocardia wallacei]
MTEAAQPLAASSASRKDVSNKREPRSGRRFELLERVTDAIVESGIEGVSVRDLAARAGVSIGTIQYYFPTKTALLLSAWNHLHGGVTHRFAGVGATGLTAAEELRYLTNLLLPPTSGDRLSHLWLALVARAGHDPEAAVLHREQWQRMESTLESALRRANPARELESRAAAAELLALLDGLAISVLIEPGRISPDRAQRISRRWLAEWLSE